jgi:UDP-N-acetyl-D-mannosaminuronate dehydrogenase
MGEVGGPLAEVLGRGHRVITRDVEPVSVVGVDVMHICYPFQIQDFVGITVDYIALHQPGITIINSTVAPGTTRTIQERVDSPVAYSPVRGKHTRMRDELLRYTKFVAATSSVDLERAATHFSDGGFSVERMTSYETLELAKLLETSYFGLLIAWAQEMDRFANHVGADYLETMKFMEEIDFLPPVTFSPGFIGGHCVIPNSQLLETVHHSPFMEAMRRSNQLKEDELVREGGSLEERIQPTPRTRALPEDAQEVSKIS